MSRARDTLRAMPAWAKALLTGAVIAASMWGLLSEDAATLILEAIGDVAPAGVD